MTKTRRQYSEEFKREAVQLTESSGKPVAEIARDLGINDNLLYRWRGEFGQRATSRSNGRSKAELEAEVKRLRRENAILRQEREVLKKAISIFSQPRS
jgi:transposase